MDFTLVVMWVGFILASYSVVGNDVIQTLGTFLTSNEKTQKWYVLWAFAAVILFAALLNGYLMNDIDYGRLDKFDMSTVGFEWYYLLPPLVLMAITRVGIPVSTTFMILTLFSLSAIPNDMNEMVASVFDNETKLGGMIQKSVMGYIIAFGSAFVIYLGISRLTEKFFIENSIDDQPRIKIFSLVLTTIVMALLSYFVLFSGANETVRIILSLLLTGLNVVGGMFLSARKFWTLYQWFTTGFLWYQWLTQDLANIYIYLNGGKDLSIGEFSISVVILLGLLALLFRSKGGAVQDVVRKKTNTIDIRSATFIDLIYGIVLYIFKYNSLGLFEAKLPMSTTWVFIGLLAGREIGIQLNLKNKKKRKVMKMVFADLGKVFFGLVVSVLLVFLIKRLAG